MWWRVGFRCPRSLTIAVYECRVWRARMPAESRIRSLRSSSSLTTAPHCSAVRWSVAWPDRELRRCRTSNSGCPSADGCTWRVTHYRLYRGRVAQRLAAAGPALHPTRQDSLSWRWGRGRRPSGRIAPKPGPRGAFHLLARSPRPLGEGEQISKVIIGMDPHKRSATIEVMTADEAVLGCGRYCTDAAGLATMLAAMRRWPERTWAFEGSRGVGRQDVPPKLPARTRVFSAGQGARPMRRTRTRSRWPPPGAKGCTRSPAIAGWRFCAS